MVKDQVYIIEGEGAKKTFSQLQAATNYKLSRDSETDRVEIGNLKKGTAATNADSALKEAIESTKIITRIISTLNNYNRYNNYIVIGTRDGNRLNSDLTVTSEQTVNPEKAVIVDKFYGMSKGVSVLHEVLEAYFSGGISPFGIGPPTMDTSTPEYKAYLKAHEMAKKADPRFIEPNVIPSGDAKKIFIAKYPSAIYDSKFNPIIEINNLTTP